MCVLEGIRMRLRAMDLNVCMCVIEGIRVRDGGGDGDV